MTQQLMDPTDEARVLAEGSSRALAAVATRHAHTIIDEDWTEARASLEDAQAVFARLLSYTDLLGRRRMNMLWKQARDRVPAERRVLAFAAVELHLLAAIPQRPILPVVEFREATEDILEREPELAPGYRAVQLLYATQHAFACAKAMSIAVAKRVRDLLVTEVRGGVARDTAKSIMDATGWSQAYADLVLVTNVRTAYSAGQWGRVADPDVRTILPAMQFRSALLETSRPGHVACHGMIAPVDSNLWERYSPPLGYRCYCGLDEISVYDLERLGLVTKDGRVQTRVPATFSAARPDDGFGQGRPDRWRFFGAS